MIWDDAAPFIGLDNDNAKGGNQANAKSTDGTTDGDT
jgi:hypothetical protein